MTITIVTLFPEVFKPLLNSSIIAKAQNQPASLNQEKKLKVNLINLRDFGLGPHKQVDDRPYGGGVGMILRVEPIHKAIMAAKKPGQKAKVILLTPQGKVFDQKEAQSLAREKYLILICGHYEGVDERVRQLTDGEISIGDYILSGGEVPAMVVLDAVTRLIPGVLEKEATQNETFGKWRVNGKWRTLLEPPQYTRPETFKVGKQILAVPKILLSGNHEEIKKWRLSEALKKTKKQRPDLLVAPDTIGRARGCKEPLKEKE